MPSFKAVVQNTLLKPVPILSSKTERLCVALIIIVAMIAIRKKLLAFPLVKILGYLTVVVTLTLIVVFAQFAVLTWPVEVGAFSILANWNKV
jgi:hypothetical protein